MSRFSRVVFLGTGSAVPSARRNQSGYAVIMSNGRQIIIDCGEGTQLQTMRSRSVRLGAVDAVMLTHSHGDHSFGLPGLLCTMQMQGRDRPLTVVGPAGLRAAMDGWLRFASGGAYPLEYEIEWVELEPGKAADFRLDAFGVGVQARPLTHTVPAFGFVLREDSRRALDARRAAELGARGPQLGELQRGNDVVVDGRTVSAAECAGPEVAGRSLAVLQDTSDSSEALEACRDVTLLVHECTLHDALRDQAVARGHSTAAMAGEYARRAGAHTLVLTHFSQRYRASAAEDDSGGGPPYVTDLVAEAAAAAGPGVAVFAAHDFFAMRAGKKSGPFAPEAELDFTAAAAAAGDAALAGR